MSTRKPLRALFAEVLLAAAPIEMSRRTDGVSVYLTFDTIGELRAWLSVAGLAEDPSVFPPHEWTDNEGRAWRSVNAYPMWRGWKVYASATEPAAADPAPLTGAARAALALVAA